MPIANEVHAVGLEDGTTVNVVAYDDDSVQIDVVGGRERFIFAATRHDDHGVPRVSVKLYPVGGAPVGDLS